MIDEPVAAVEQAPAPVPEHVHEPVQQVEDAAAAVEEAHPEEDADNAVPVLDAEQELDGEDSSGDSSDRKAASTEDDAVPDGRKYNHPYLFIYPSILALVHKLLISFPENFLFRHPHSNFPEPAVFLPLVHLPNRSSGGFGQRWIRSPPAFHGFLRKLSHF
jgi:hypothetical protein